MCSGGDSETLRAVHRSVKSRVPPDFLNCDKRVARGVIRPPSASPSHVASRCRSGLSQTSGAGSPSASCRPSWEYGHVQSCHHSSYNVGVSIEQRDAKNTSATGIALVRKSPLPRVDGDETLVRWPSKAVVKQSTALEGHRTSPLSTVDAVTHGESECSTASEARGENHRCG